MRKYIKEIILGLFAVAIVGLGMVQYRYAEIGLYVARVQFENHVNNAFNTIKTDLSTNNQLTFLILHTIQKDSSYFTLSFDSLQTATTAFLDKYLQDKLLGAGIRTEFAYQLLQEDQSILMQSRRQISSTAPLVHTVQITGYLPQTFGTPMHLRLYFSDINSYLLQKLNGIILPGILFTVLLIAAVVWIFRRVYYQNRVITTTNDFINNLTHELKTPVFSISLAAKILENESPYREHPALQHIKTQNERLKSQIEKVLQLAGMEAKGYVMQLKPQNIRSLLEALAAEYLLKSQVEQFDFEAVISLESIPVRVDWDNFRNALVNLLENAVKHAPGATVRLEVQAHNGGFHFTVQDNGPGIPEADRRQVLKKYYRGSTSTAQQRSGHGLGLHYVAQVMRFHKGRVRLLSTPGSGTTVTLYLPKWNGHAV